MAATLFTITITIKMITIIVIKPLRLEIPSGKWREIFSFLAARLKRTRIIK